jgi:hypothetical protein
MEERVDTIVGILKQSYETMSALASEVGPKLAAALIVMVAGVVVARGAKAGVRRLLGVLRFEAGAERIGMTSALKRAEIGKTPTEVVCMMVYWSGLVFVLLCTFGTVGIAGTQAMHAVIGVIPKVVLAVAILVLGLNLSGFVSKVVQTAAVNSEIRQGRLVRNATHYALSALVVLLALKQLDLSTQLLGTAFLIFFGATCFGAALAFGLGCKDLARGIAQSTLETEKEKARSLSEASELGDAVFPHTTARRARPRSVA